MGKKRIHQRPTHPDGSEYEFDCCAAPQVFEYADDRIECRTCGYDWSDSLDI